LIAAAEQVNTEVFILNGDIFDFFFGWSTYFQNKFQNVFLALQKLAASGCRVIFVEGNHEFGMSRMPTEGIEYVDSFGLTVETKDNRTIRVVHGDLMKYDWKYHLYRRLVRSYVVSLIAVVFPQVVLDRLTLWLAGTSRKKDQYRELHHDKILEIARAILQRSKTNHLIFGHFHHPYEENDGQGRYILSVSSWDHPSCLVLKEGVFQRVLVAGDSVDRNEARVVT